MEKGKRILAIIGIILLVALYGLTLFAAFFDNTDTMRSDEKKDRPSRS